MLQQPVPYAFGSSHDLGNATAAYQPLKRRLVTSTQPEVGPAAGQEARDLERVKVIGQRAQHLGQARHQSPEGVNCRAGSRRRRRGPRSAHSSPAPMR